MFTPTALRSIARSAARPSTLPMLARSAVAVTAAPSRIAGAGMRAYSDKPAEEPAAAADGSAKEVDGEAEKIKGLEDKIKSLEKDIMYQRAETQTMARRVEDERRKASEFAISKFAQSLLDTTDTFAVALKHVPKPIEPNTPLASLVQGVELTQKALLKTFEQNKVLKMDIKQGDGFDPNLHEATFQLPKEVAPPKKDGGAWESGQVVEVTKEGWMIGQRVLRPAQVGVIQIE